MSQKDKNIRRLKSYPNDLTYEELKSILESLGYREENRGKTSGSSVMFVNGKDEKIFIHKPHPTNVVKRIYIKQIVGALKERGELK